LRLTRIGAKLVVTVAAILAAQVAVRSWVEYRSDADNFRQDFLRTGRAHALALAKAAEYGLLAGDKVELVRVAEARRTAADSDLLYVAFYGADGYLLASRDWADDPGLIPAAAGPVMGVTDERAGIGDPAGEFYRFKVPVFMSNRPEALAVPGSTAKPPRRAGGRAMVVCARSYTHVTRRIAEAQRNVARISALMLGGALLVVVIFGRGLVRPIRQLVRGTERVAEGNLDTRVDVGRRHDELGLLADSFNRMTSQLREQREQILGYSQSLEQKVAARTTELADTNTRLQAANEQLAQLATTDEMTGVWNRRRFIEMLAQECRRADRADTHVSLAMVDVDRFKAVNDTFGHDFGDVVLKAVADRLTQAARETDIVARYGGEEFMVLMPDTSAEEALVAAERVRCHMANHPVGDGKLSVEVSISIGVSARTLCGRTDPDDLVRMADEALYAAKQSGRNCIRTWDDISDDEDRDVATSTEEVTALQRRMAALSLQAKDAFVQSIHGLVRALEARDPYTRHHSENVTQYAVAISEQMGLDPDEVAVIRRAARVHDLGKIGVPDTLLRKRGQLDERERRAMRNHVLIGVRILEQLRFMERELPLVRHHHERWDGAGYPEGVSGEAIPMGARILAVADTFDALTSDRPYHDAIEVSDALRILIEESGKQFDPDVVDALLAWMCAAGRELGGSADLTPADILAAGAEEA